MFEMKTRPIINSVKWRYCIVFIYIYLYLNIAVPREGVLYYIKKAIWYHSHMSTAEKKFWNVRNNDAWERQSGRQLSRNQESDFVK